MTIPASLQRTDYGYYELRQKPTAMELHEFYAQRYYQQNHASYQHAYSPEELTYTENQLRLHRWVLEHLLTAPAPHRLLDVGCGEGWAMAHFTAAGWDVMGLDFSSYSLMQFHPDLCERLRPGDLYEQLARLATEGQQFAALWLDNVLEHVLDPVELLRLCRALIQPGGVVLVDVPNDFSPLQDHLLAAGHVDHPYWVTLPDHLSYFNAASLRNLAVATGWQLTKTLADQPIDLNLLTPSTNYVLNRSAGPAAHHARIEQGNLVMRTAPLPAVAAYYEGMAGVGLGRSIVAFLQPA